MQYSVSDITTALHAYVVAGGELLLRAVRAADTYELGFIGARTYTLDNCVLIDAAISAFMLSIWVVNSARRASYWRAKPILYSSRAAESCVTCDVKASMTGWKASITAFTANWTWVASIPSFSATFADTLRTRTGRSTHSAGAPRERKV